MLDKHLSEFVAWAIAIGLTANVFARYLFGFGDIGALAIFAFLIGILALVFPIRVEPLPKDTVDFWYYLLGILTVLAVFANNESERRKLILAYEYQQVLVEKANLDGRLAAFRRTVAKPDETFGQLRSRSREIAENLVKTKEYFCGCAMPSARCGGQPGLPGSSARFGMGEPASEGSSSRTAFAELCNNYANAKSEEIWFELSNLTTLSDLAGFNIRALKGSGQQVSIIETSVIHDITTG